MGNGPVMQFTIGTLLPPITREPGRIPGLTDLDAFGNQIVPTRRDVRRE